MTEKDLSKSLLYQGVKTLLETEAPHLLLPQHKLFTLFSIGFQYFLYLSTKNPGHYIVRIEDSPLTDKLVRRAKDPSSRKFLQSLLLPRKLKYGGSHFHLDFSHPGSWAHTNCLPRDKLRGALIVKNPNTAPMQELEEGTVTVSSWLFPLLRAVPKSVTIACRMDCEDWPVEAQSVELPFIKREPLAPGVTINEDIDIDD